MLREQADAQCDAYYITSRCIDDGTYPLLFQNQNKIPHSVTNTQKKKHTHKKHTQGIQGNPGHHQNRINSQKEH